MVYVQVDMSHPENQNLKPELEGNEFIECFTVPVSGLFAELQKLEGEGYAIDARVGSIAEGIEIAKRLNI
jgi:ADP-ribose pyrophosphatase